MRSVAAATLSARFPELPRSLLWLSLVPYALPPMRARVITARRLRQKVGHADGRVRRSERCDLRVHGERRDAAVLPPPACGERRLPVDLEDAGDDVHDPILRDAPGRIR